MNDTLPPQDVIATPAAALLTCAFTVNRMAEQLGRIYEVSAREVFAITELVITGPMSASELADRLYLTRGAVTGMVRRLTEQGWIESAPDRLDGRRVVIRATDRPARLLQLWTGRFGEAMATRVGDDQVDEVAAAVSACARELESHRTTLRRLGPAEIREYMRVH